METISSEYPYQRIQFGTEIRFLDKRNCKHAMRQSCLHTIIYFISYVYVHNVLQRNVYQMLLVRAEINKFIDPFLCINDVTGALANAFSASDFSQHELVLHAGHSYLISNKMNG